jgi:hypothetical protein
MKHVPNDDERVGDEGEGSSALDCALSAILRVLEAELALRFMKGNFQRPACVTLAGRCFINVPLVQAASPSSKRCTSCFTGAFAPEPHACFTGSLAQRVAKFLAVDSFALHWRVRTTLKQKT